MPKSPDSTRPSAGEQPLHRFELELTLHKGSQLHSHESILERPRLRPVLVERITP
jgi:hypothetical protein